MTDLIAGKLLVIGAHAGDAENMAGATVLKHTRAGHGATIVHMTLGEAGHPSLPPEVYAEQRKKEVKESARLMSAEVIWLPYRDGELPVNEEIKSQVCDLIRQEKPTIILTHWKGSIHKDHVATHDIVRDAIFYAALPAIKRESPAHRVQGVYFPENWEDMDGWRADVYLDVSDVWEDYVSVLRSHEFTLAPRASAGVRGGISSFRYFDYYTALGTTRGCLGGFQKAVALMMQPGAWVRKLQHLPGLEPSHS
jgi:LmbE family N-acetylglucosaminyl deacetylase